MKKVYTLFKKAVFGFFFLYGFNVIASPLNLLIPINFFTISLFALLGIPSVFALLIIKLFLF